MEKMCEQKELLTEDTLVNILTYIKLAQGYIAANSLNVEVLNLGLIIDNMYEKIMELKPYYEILESV